MNTQRLSVITISLLVASSSLLAQRPIHYRYNIDMPPGAIGSLQTQQNPPFRGYVQPVRLRAPDGAEVSIGSNSAFQFPGESLQVGLFVGQVYRLKVAQIPRNEGAEVYPSIELINRLYPPPGQKWRFPVEVDIAQEDLELALEGKMVVRVIYVENPNEAFPESEDPRRQRYFDVLPEEDPLQVADENGRPIAILRLGSRLPGLNENDDQFLFGSPPVTLMTGWSEPMTHRLFPENIWVGESEEILMESEYEPADPVPDGPAATDVLELPDDGAIGLPAPVQDPPAIEAEELASPFDDPPQ